MQTKFLNNPLSNLQFKQHRIVGVAFITITQQELKTELKINEYGLIKTFVMERDKLISEYKQLRMDTLSTTQSNTNSKLPNTPSSSTRKLPHCLMNQIHGNLINDDKQNHKEMIMKTKSKSKSLQEINDERETSPLLIDTALPITNNSSNHTNHTLNTNTTTTYTEITTNQEHHNH